MFMAGKSSRQGLDGERILALFIDFENVGIGLNNRRDRFDISRVVERLVEKGKIVVKRAYADWSRFAQYTAPLHEAAIELIEIPRRAMTGKNSADIRLVVDAIDLAYSKDHIDTFVILSGDSDFSPLVSKLKELGKHVIGLGLAEATSELLRDNCDEFIYYEDLDRPSQDIPGLDKTLPEPKKKLFQLVVESLMALRRENKEVLWSSMVKDTMKRKKPSFNEEYHGYRTFSELLEDAQKCGVLELETNQTSGTYVVTRFGTELVMNKPKERLPAPAPKERLAIAGPRERTPIVVTPPPSPVTVSARIVDRLPPATPVPPSVTADRPPVTPTPAPAAPAAKPPIRAKAQPAPAPSPAVRTRTPAPQPKPVAPRAKPATPPASKPPVPPKPITPPEEDLDLDFVEGRHGFDESEDEFGKGL
jgi:uncharacterized protein (TIGR00288 family)